MRVKVCASVMQCYKEQTTPRISLSTTGLSLRPQGLHVEIFTCGGETRWPVQPTTHVSHFAACSYVAAYLPGIQCPLQRIAGDRFIMRHAHQCQQPLVAFI